MIHTQNCQYVIFATDTATNEEKTPDSTECSPAEILGGVVTAASQYLYPCTVQYSLIAAGEQNLDFDKILFKATQVNV